MMAEARDGPPSAVAPRGATGEVGPLSETQPDGARYSAPPPARAEALEPGDMIDGKYRVVRTLGRGGMGTVLLAEDVVLGREVAIKFLGTSLAGSATWRPRFFEEARSMARVHHVNVVQIHSVGSFDGLPYFVMEYVPGVSLAQWLVENEQPSPHEILPILRQLAAAVDAIHDAGLVHLDIKPPNVLVGPGLRVALADLGLSRLAGSMGPRGAGGTPSYMAPEQIDRRRSNPELDRKTDVYQLGVLTFELLTGQVPFQADTDAALMAKHCVAAPPRPSVVRPDLPPSVDEPVLAALAKSASRRPESGRELVDGIARAFAPAQADRRLRILVADDDDAQLGAERQLLREAFGETAEIVSARDGGEALHHAELGPWDVIILDLHMPVLSGLEVAAILQERGLQGRAQVLMVTALGGAADWRVVQHLGVKSMLLKPLDADLFIESVKRLAERARRP